MPESGLWALDYLLTFFLIFLSFFLTMSYDNDELELEEYNTVKGIMKDVTYAIQDGALSQGSIWLYRSVITVVKIYLTRNIESIYIGNRFSWFLGKIKPVFNDEDWKEILEDNSDILKRYPLD